MTVKGGKHLGAVRNWMQWKALNGDSVTWGSNEELRFSCVLCPALFEELAQDIRDATVAEVGKNVERTYHILDRLEQSIKAVPAEVAWGDRESAEWDCMLLKNELKKVVEDLGGF